MLNLHQIPSLRFSRQSQSLPANDEPPFPEEASHSFIEDTDDFRDNFNDLEDIDYYEEHCPFSEADLRFLRDFILSSAMYVEELESLVCDTSEDFWEAREHAYRIVTAALINHFLYEMEEPGPRPNYRD